MSGKNNGSANKAPRAKGAKPEPNEPQQQDAAFAALAAVGFGEDALLACMDGGEDEGDAGDLGELKTALERVIQSKSQKARQKQSAILGELQAGLAASVKALEASIGQEAKAAEGACTRRFEGIARHLQAKFEEIEALNQKYQQDLHTRWEQYQELYAQLEAAKADTSADLDKRRAALKRKVGAAAQEAADRLHAAQQKITKSKSQASKLPGLAKVLRAFL